MNKSKHLLWLTPLVWLVSALLILTTPTQAAVVYSNAGNECSVPLCGGPTVGGNVWWASGFAVPVGSDYTINRVTLFLSSGGKSIEAALYSDNGGMPGSQITSLGSQTVSTGGNGSVPQAFDYATSTVAPGGTSFFIVVRGTTIGTADAIWPDTVPLTAPSGIFPFTSVAVTTNSGGSWAGNGSRPGIEIDASVFVPTTTTPTTITQPAWDPGDDRIGPYLGATLNGYCKDYGLALYTTVGGELIVTNEQIDTVGIPEVNTLIASGAGMWLYRLSGGPFQVMEVARDGKQELLIFEKEGCAIGRWRRGQFYLSSHDHLRTVTGLGWLSRRVLDHRLNIEL